MYRHDTIPQQVLQHLQATGNLLFRQSDLACLDGYDHIDSTLQHLEENFFIERVEDGWWRLLPRRQPRLEVNRTWSKPSGVSDDILIAVTLTNPTVSDLARLVHVFGLRRLWRILAMLIETNEIHPKIAEVTSEMLDNIEKGAIHAYRCLAN